MFKNNAEREMTILIFNKFSNGADHHSITTINKYGTVRTCIGGACRCIKHDGLLLQSKKISVVPLVYCFFGHDMHCHAPNRIEGF